ncbi:DUF4054 domain-containing protein [Paenibacillus periandrae]|uniref:DUF4054 domain-containing protein n=1 Tax=Paenibacillus periandrae TaxID=1761741 RepID=UPI001F099556|nr:DUF4054 domain-containing protein [Paenibacillus periandrae]
MKTTIQKVRGIAAHLTGMKDEDLQLYVDDAYDDVINLYGVPDEKAERLNRYLAAHMATLNIRRAILKKAADLQVQYARADSVGGSEYLDEFNRLLALLTGKGPRIGLMVL